MIYMYATKIPGIAGVHIPSDAYPFPAVLPTPHLRARRRIPRISGGLVQPIEIEPQSCTV